MKKTLRQFKIRDILDGNQYEIYDIDSGEILIVALSDAQIMSLGIVIDSNEVYIAKV